MDLTLLRKLLKVPFSTPSEAFYLELGIIPIGVILKARRVNYLHYILTREESEMLYTFFITQWHNETPGDWTQQIRIDLEDLKIPCDFEFLKSKSDFSFKAMVKIKAKEYALNILTDRQRKHSKMSNLHYTELKIQDYFKIEGINIKQVQNLFKWRVRMAPMGENFRGSEKAKMCPLCQAHLDSQNLAFECENLKQKIDIQCELKDIYSNNIILRTAKTITEMEEHRDKSLKELKKQNQTSMLP